MKMEPVELSNHLVQAASAHWHLLVASSSPPGEAFQLGKRSENQGGCSVAQNLMLPSGSKL